MSGLDIFSQRMAKSGKSPAPLRQTQHSIELIVESDTLPQGFLCQAPFSAARNLDDRAKKMQRRQVMRHKVTKISMTIRAGHADFICKYCSILDLFQADTCLTVPLQALR